MQHKKSDILFGIVVVAVPTVLLWEFGWYLAKHLVWNP